MSVGERCKRCGNCCKAIPCGIGSAMLGDYRPCKALEEDGDHYSCGMVTHPSRYLDMGDYAEWKDEFLGQVFARMLGVGLGCCSSPEGELLNAEMRKRFLDRASFKAGVISTKNPIAALANDFVERLTKKAQ